MDKNWRSLNDPLRILKILEGSRLLSRSFWYFWTCSSERTHWRIWRYLLKDYLWKSSIWSDSLRILAILRERFPLIRILLGFLEVSQGRCIDSLKGRQATGGFVLGILWRIVTCPDPPCGAERRSWVCVRRARRLLPINNRPKDRCRPRRSSSPEQGRWCRGVT